MPAEPPAPSRPALLESLAVYAASTLCAAILYRSRFPGSYLTVLVAGLFLYLPAFVVYRQGLALEAFGLRLGSLVTTAGLLFGVCAAILPAFAVGFGLWQRLACSYEGLAALAPADCHGIVPSWLSLRLRLPPSPWQTAAGELLVVALPEEFFFRGYLQTRLKDLARRRVRLLGADCGLELVWASALFALTHWVVQGQAATLVVFFPGLIFGWLRARSDSIVPGALFHALCNLYIDILQRSLFG